MNYYSVQSVPQSNNKDVISVLNLVVCVSKEKNKTNLLALITFHSLVSDRKKTHISMTVVETFSVYYDVSTEYFVMEI